MKEYHVYNSIIYNLRPHFKKFDMYFKPVDENSLRHLFTMYSKELKMFYLGPYINSSNVKEDSPDCIIADLRKEHVENKKCEFKYIPTTVKDFEHNNSFDIAIVWDLGCERAKLEEELFIQNECKELVVLKRDYGYFSNLKDYNRVTINELADYNYGKLLVVLYKKKISSLYALYLAIEAFPNAISMKETVKILGQKFPTVRDMKKQGSSNVVTAFCQTTPKLLEVVEAGIYRYTDEFPKGLVKTMIEERIRKSQIELPTANMVNAVIHSGF